MQNLKPCTTSNSGFVRKRRNCRQSIQIDTIPETTPKSHDFLNFNPKTEKLAILKDVIIITMI